MPPTADEMRALPIGKVLETLEIDWRGAEHRIRVGTTDELGTHRGLRRCRIECVSCACVLAEHTPWPDPVIHRHMDDRGYCALALTNSDPPTPVS